MPPKRPGPTIRDVAARAGVSVRTVSRLLSGQPVSAPTQLRIEAVMRELEYVPSAAARALRGQGTRLLGVLVEGATPARPGSGLLRGIQEVASEQGVLVLLAETDGTADHLEESLEAFLAQRVEAIVRVSPVHREVCAGPHLSSLPVVLANAEAPRARRGAVLADPVGAARTATETLLDLGHSRVGLVLPSSSNRTTAGCEEGYRAALDAAAHPPDPAVVVSVPVLPARSVQPARASGLATLLSHASPPTALLCVGLDVALQTLTDLMSRGVSVPSQMSLLCITEDVEDGESLHPALAVVALGHRELGRRAAQRALAGSGSGVERVSLRVVLRRSVRSRRL